jgi:hypothetical protein
MKMVERSRTFLVLRQSLLPGKCMKGIFASGWEVAFPDFFFFYTYWLAVGQGGMFGPPIEEAHSRYSVSGIWHGDRRNG